MPMRTGRQGGIWSRTAKHIGKGARAIGRGVKKGLKYLGTEGGDQLLKLAGETSELLGGPDIVTKGLEKARKIQSTAKDLRGIADRAGTLTQGTVGMKRSSSTMNESSTSMMQGNRAGLRPPARESMVAPTPIGAGEISLARKRLRAS